MSGAHPGKGRHQAEHHQASVRPDLRAQPDLPLCLVGGSSTGPTWTFLKWCLFFFPPPAWVQVEIHWRSRAHGKRFFVGKDVLWEGLHAGGQPSSTMAGALSSWICFVLKFAPGIYFRPSLHPSPIWPSIVPLSTRIAVLNRWHTTFSILYGKLRAVVKKELSLVDIFLELYVH